MVVVMVVVVVVIVIGSSYEESSERALVCDDRANGAGEVDLPGGGRKKN